MAERVSDYPLVEQFVQEAPWFGRGGWTYIPDNGLDILDNQYLKTAVELGMVGVIALAVFFLVPSIAALVARRRSSDPELRLLCGALAGAALAAAACSLTFDSLSYPMFIGLYALVIGLIGAPWRLAAVRGSGSCPSRAEFTMPSRSRVPPIRPANWRVTVGPASRSLERLWRHRIATLPVITITLLGAIYVVAFKATRCTWAPSRIHVLINPPAPPVGGGYSRATRRWGASARTTPTRASPDQSVIVGLLASELEQ